MSISATKAMVKGSPPPDSFLDELVKWAKTADGDIFSPRPGNDIYTRVFPQLGPYRGDRHRVGVMLEVLRVLAGFESTWNWNQGVYPANSHKPPREAEAGPWQVSANSMQDRPELQALVQARVRSTQPIDFQAAMKRDHTLAIEYTARLLRRSYAWSHPLINPEINAYFSPAAVQEFVSLVYPIGDFPSPDRARHYA